MDPTESLHWKIRMKHMGKSYLIVCLTWYKLYWLRATNSSPRVNEVSANDKRSLLGLFSHHVASLISCQVFTGQSKRRALPPNHSEIFISILSPLLISQCPALALRYRKHWSGHLCASLPPYVLYLTMLVPIFTTRFVKLMVLQCHSH